MKTADIQTPQQVVIRYELATLRERASAFVLDQVLLWFSLLMAAGFLGLVGALDSPYLRFFAIGSLILLLYGFGLICEIVWDGQTVGKRIVGLKVIKLTGVEAKTGDYAVRWAFRLLDIWASLGALGSLMISTTPNAQRIGDLLADTIVVRLRPRQHIELSQLLRMHTESPSSAVYARAGRFSEEDMVLVMDLLDRVRSCPNVANHQLLRDLCERMSQEMSLPAPPADPERFARQVIRDYVLITR